MGRSVWTLGEIVDLVGLDVVVVVGGAGAAVLEGEASGLVPLPHPVSSMDAASRTASGAAGLFRTSYCMAFHLTVSPTVMRTERRPDDPRKDSDSR